MRKWTYLVGTLLMAGTTATFTGCIDTDEPEGIAELRGAKSDFIKAQAAVELVEAELRKAQVAEQELVNAGLALQNKSAEMDIQQLLSKEFCHRKLQIPLLLQIRMKARRLILLRLSIMFILLLKILPSLWMAIKPVA